LVPELGDWRSVHTKVEQKKTEVCENEVEQKKGLKKRVICQVF